MNTSEIRDVLREVTFPGYTLDVHPDGCGSYMQASFIAPCATSMAPVRQTTRKWRLSQHMTRSEIVQMALKLVLTSVEHETRENFRYRGQPIFGPHFDVDALHALATDGAHDRREEITL